jgi:MYXO-CTERM domain-containing protein
MIKTWFASLLLMGWAAGCGTAVPAETTSTTSSRIENGTPDATHTFAVGVVQLNAQTASICTGALLAPNLVATARHCVAQIGSGAQIDCKTSTFGSVVPTSRLFVTTDAIIGMANQSFSPVASIVVPSGADHTNVCGNDIALLILADNVTLPQYVVPVIAPPMTDHTAYSTAVTAIGYGVDVPTDTQGMSAGTRRIKESIPLTCIPNDKTFVDCFIDPVASQNMTSQNMTSGEFLSGKASTCEGDSGSNAFDQKNFSKGKWVSFGVLSRGGVSPDGMTCGDSIYTRFDAWGPLLVSTANQAASMGGYTVPAWAAASSAGLSDGMACGADSECSSRNCVVVGQSSNAFVCASPCNANGCAANFECVGGFCFSGSQNTSQSQPPHSGGCALSTVDAPRGARPYAAAALVVTGLIVGRRRRRTHKQLSGSGQSGP